MDGLTAEQISAVAQLSELTNGSDEDVAINVLRSVDWDVEVRNSLYTLYKTQVLYSAQPTSSLAAPAPLHLHQHHQRPLPLSESRLTSTTASKDTSTLHPSQHQQYVTITASPLPHC